MSNTQFDNHTPISNKNTQERQTGHGIETHGPGDTLTGPGSGVYRSSHTAGMPSGGAKPTNAFGEGHAPLAPDFGNSQFNNDRSAQFGAAPLLGQPGHVAPSAGANVDPGPFAVDQTKGLPGAPTDSHSRTQHDILSDEFGERHQTGRPTSKDQTGFTSTKFDDRHQSGIPMSKGFDSKGLDTDRQFETGKTSTDHHGSFGHDEANKDTFGTHDNKKYTNVGAGGHTAPGHIDNKGTTTASTNPDHYSAGPPKDDHYPHDPTKKTQTAGSEHHTKPGIGDKIAGKTEKIMGKISGEPALQERGERKAQGPTKN